MLALHPNHYRKTDILKLRIELEPGAVPTRPLNPDQRVNLKEQLDEWIQQPNNHKTCEEHKINWCILKE